MDEFINELLAGGIGVVVGVLGTKFASKTVTEVKQKAAQMATETLTNTFRQSGIPEQYATQAAKAVQSSN